MELSHAARVTGLQLVGVEDHAKSNDDLLDLETSWAGGGHRELGFERSSTSLASGSLREKANAKLCFIRSILRGSPVNVIKLEEKHRKHLHAKQSRSKIYLESRLIEVPFDVVIQVKLRIFAIFGFEMTLNGRDDLCRSARWIYNLVIDAESAGKAIIRSLAVV